MISTSILRGTAQNEAIVHNFALSIAVLVCFVLYFGTTAKQVHFADHSKYSLGQGAALQQAFIPVCDFLWMLNRPQC